MAFPTNPTNGQTADINGVVYTYSSALTAWQVITNFSGNATINQLTANSIVSASSLGADLFTGNSITVTGNVTGANLVLSTAATVGTTLSVTGNVSGANITTGGSVVASGNVSGANLNSAGVVSVGGSLTVATTSSFAGTITATSILPVANATHDLGNPGYRWRNIYTSDLHLNNGIGNWTIVEGADNLFLHNNRNGKVYTFALTEVDPSQSPPKQKED